MKKILILNLIFLFFSCCEKEKLDPRDKYLGIYQGTFETIPYGDQNCDHKYSIKDTSICVKYGKTDTSILVMEFEVYPDMFDSTGYYAIYHYNIRIWNDSLISSNTNGGLGCGINEVFKGYKISNICY